MTTSDQTRPSLAANVRRQPYKSPIVLLTSSLLVTTWWYFGSPAFLQAHLPDALRRWGDPAGAAAACSFVAALALLGLVPALVVKLVFHERLADYGVQFGDRFRTCRSFLVFAPAVVLVAWLSARSPAIRAYYPLDRGAGASPGAFGVHAAFYVLFYLGWEFHFRGFLQHGLRGTMGDVQAILVQILASTLAHLGRPAVETYASIGAGLLWGILAFRTRSLLSGLLQHALLGIALDFFICFG
jgi:membrane protease YdiL (CAAX protease family)